MVFNVFLKKEQKIVLKVILESVSLKSMEFTTLKTPTKKQMFKPHYSLFFIELSYQLEEKTVLSCQPAITFNNLREAKRV